MPDFFRTTGVSMARNFAGQQEDKDVQHLRADVYALSVALSAALALAARHDPHPEALSHLALRIQEAGKSHTLLPANPSDRSYVQRRITDIMSEARLILGVEFEFDKKPDVAALQEEVRRLREDVDRLNNDHRPGAGTP